MMICLPLLWWLFPHLDVWCKWTLTWKKQGHISFCEHRSISNAFDAALPGVEQLDLICTLQTLHIGKSIPKGNRNLQKLHFTISIRWKGAKKTVTDLKNPRRYCLLCGPISSFCKGHLNTCFAFCFLMTVLTYHLPPATSILLLQEASCITNSLTGVQYAGQDGLQVGGRELAHFWE